MLTISRDDYRKRVQGCWLGKAVGGTLGMPYEGQLGPHSLTFYDPVPTGVIPNDDLDLQVLWAELLDRHGPFLSRLDLAKGWREHTDFPWDEYGSASANFARGIFPPASGHHLNFCGDCLGSPIRSEIWAVLAPGDPELACKLAYEDAILDHDGEGIWGELFLAALESAAFVTQNRDKLIAIGLSVIPEECKIAQAIRSTIAWYQADRDWRVVREKILAKFGKHNFTDVPQNLAFVILGWLAGKDFGDAICIAVNCGRDADCTGASLGAILGIIDPDAIEDKWKKPISEELVLSPGMKNMNPPKTIDGFSSLTIRLAEQMVQARSTCVCFGDIPNTTDFAVKLKPFQIDASLNTILLANGPLKITAEYPNGLTFVPGESMTVTFHVENTTASAIDFAAKLLLPTGWTITRGEGGVLSLKAGELKTLPFTLAVPAHLRMYLEQLTLRLEAGGLRSDYSVPMVSGWQWQMTVGDQSKAVWLPERRLISSQSIKPGEQLTASTKFHLSRQQRVRVILASNGSGSLSVDGKKVLEYTDAEFMPMTHRAEKDTFCDLDLALGLHKLELSLSFKSDAPRAALLFADSENTLLIHDITVATDLTH